MPRAQGCLEARFWSKVLRGDPGECWPWTAGCYKNKYGKFKLVAGQLEMERTNSRGAHRVAFRLTYGYWPENAMHTCDNPPCCNPAHLQEGTQAENLEDMTRKGRRSRGAAQSTMTPERRALRRHTDGKGW